MTDTTDRLYVALRRLGIVVLANLLGSFFGACCIRFAWLWFVVPFGVVDIGPAHAYVAFVFANIFQHISVADHKEIELAGEAGSKYPFPPLRRIFHATLKYAFTLGVLTVVHWVAP